MEDGCFQAKSEPGRHAHLTTAGGSVNDVDNRSIAEETCDRLGSWHELREGR